MFRDARVYQKTQNDSLFRAVVVLDEVGLAEDSARMPLKVLHSELEAGDVAFLGLSNWALDPAKMNRGLFVSRPPPGVNELVTTARGIASSGLPGGSWLETIMQVCD